MQYLFKLAFFKHKITVSWISTFLNVTYLLESFKKVSRWAWLSEYFDKPLREKCVYGKLSKKYFCWKSSNISWVFESNFCFPGKGFRSFTHMHWGASFRKTCICREIKFIIVVNFFSVSCVSFKMFSVHYGKCILPTYPKWNIRQALKFNILWASSNAKFFDLLNARHTEICLRYLLRSFPSVSLQKRYFIFLIYPNGQKHVTQPLYLK